ncbi:MAG: DUF4214 domain-containing protein [Acidimicrobiia bacterium]|nr:DUF4214 domain-containing protein [Acidimicrobiia bacterium]
MTTIRSLARLLAVTLLAVAALAVAGPAGGVGAQTPSFASDGSEFGAAGPYEVVVDSGSEHTYFSPSDLGAAGVRHPVILWGNGTGASPTSYAGLLRHWASHGFIVAAANTPNAGSGADMLRGLDNLIAFDRTPSNRFYGHVDTTRAATSGHSQGAYGAIQAARSGRVDTAMPVQGGFAAADMTASVLFLSGGLDTIIRPAVVRSAFDASTAVPAAYGELLGANHFVPARDGGGYRAVTTAWARWMLMGDPDAAAQFQGEACGLCTSAEWTYAANPWLEALELPMPATPEPAPPAPSPHTTGPDAFSIQRLYHAHFGRSPDAGGLAYWTSRHAAGMSLGAVSDHFARSAEFRSLYGELDDRGFVRLVYANVLNRGPDARGLAHWVATLETRRLSRGGVMVAFSDSAEFKVFIRLPPS